MDTELVPQLRVSEGSDLGLRFLMAINRQIAINRLLAADFSLTEARHD